jgi:hypothetical protein
MPRLSNPNMSTQGISLTGWAALGVGGAGLSEAVSVKMRILGHALCICAMPGLDQLQAGA